MSADSAPAPTTDAPAAHAPARDTPARVTPEAAARPGRVGAVMLVLVSVAVAIVAGIATLGVALSTAQDQFDRLQEDKALSRGLRIGHDLNIAIGLGIPLAEIRGMHEYAEAIPTEDPDIRFVAITDTDLNRLHYGGMGRRRLDPLLEEPVLKDIANGVLRGDVQAGTTAEIGEFAITPLPLLDPDGEPLGFIHVAIQGRQLGERFFEAVWLMWPLGLLALVLVAEVAGFAYAAGFREPVARLAALMRTAATQGSPAGLSGRHAGGTLGATMFGYNAVLHRLARRTERLVGYASEVRDAVFEPRAMRKIDEIEKAARADAAHLDIEIERKLDARPSDIRFPFVAGLAIGAISILWPLVMADPTRVTIGSAVALGVLAFTATVRSPILAIAVVLFALIVGPTLETAHLGGYWPALAAASAALLGLCWQYRRKNALTLSPTWLAARVATAIAIVALTLLTFNTLTAVPTAAAFVVLAAALSLVLRDPVRRLLFRSAQNGAPSEGDR